MTPVASRPSAAASDAANNSSCGGGPSPRDLYEAGEVTAALNLLAENAASNRRAAAGGEGKAPSKKDATATTTATTMDSHFDTPQEEYNGVLLTALATRSTSDAIPFLDNMNKVSNAVTEHGESNVTSKAELERMIVSYNLSLIQLVSNCPHFPLRLLGCR